MNGIQCRNISWPQSIKPIPDQDKWPATEHPTILPPVIKRGVGRPCRNRKTIKCEKCGDFGHNKATCKGGAIKKQKATRDTDNASTSKSKGKLVVKQKASSKKGKGKAK